MGAVVAASHRPYPHTVFCRRTRTAASQRTERANVHLSGFILFTLVLLHSIPHALSSVNDYIMTIRGHRVLKPGRIGNSG